MKVLALLTLVAAVHGSALPYYLHSETWTLFRDGFLGGEKLHVTMAGTCTVNERQTEYVTWTDSVSTLPPCLLDDSCSKAMYEKNCWILFSPSDAYEEFILANKLPLPSESLDIPTALASAMNAIVRKMVKRWDNRIYVSFRDETMAKYIFDLESPTVIIGEQMTHYLDGLAVSRRSNQGDSSLADDAPFMIIGFILTQLLSFRLPYLWDETSLGYRLRKLLNRKSRQYREPTSTEREQLKDAKLFIEEQCVVCRDAEANILHLPCHHLVCCASCLENLISPNCMMCNTRIDQNLLYRPPEASDSSLEASVT